MSPIPPKNELLAIVDREKAYWDSLIDGVPFDQMTNVPIEADWTFRDVTAHLLAWREWGLARLDAIARNQPLPKPPYPAAFGDDVDQINAWFHEQYRNRSAEDVTSAFSAAFDRLKDALSRFSEADLADPDKFPYLEGNSLGQLIADGRFFDHIHDEHGPAIEIWQKRVRGK